MNPILLPKNHHITSLIINKAHKLVFHLGIQCTLNKIRLLGFWIPRARNTIHNIISKCITCKKFQSFTFKYPKFTNFSKLQVQFYRPFKCIGMDLTGAVQILDPVTKQVTKMYIMIICCVNIRAVSLHLIEDMTTRSILLTFQIFCSKFSVPDYVQSDNAKYFSLMGKVLDEALVSDEFSDHMRKCNIKYIKLPVFSPWMSFGYERHLRTIKGCLYKTIGTSTMSFFEANCLLQNIASAVNSRPLTYTSSNDTIVPLTPNSFLKLHGDETLVYNQDNINDPLWIEDPTSKDILIESLNALKTKYNFFKTLWYERYLLGLREYSRDLYETDWNNMIKVDDVVIIKAPAKSRPYYKLGRVIELIYGTDYKVRVVKLKRADGSEVLVPISLLYPLELSITHPGNKTTLEKTPELEQEAEPPERPRRAAAEQATAKISDMYQKDDKIEEC